MTRMELSRDTSETPPGAEPVAILLLERSAGSLALVSQALPGINVHALPIADTALAPDLISREKISVAFCDQDYADPVAGRFRQQLLRVHPTLAIVQVVAAGELNTVLDVFRQGVSDVLIAPLTPAEVCHAFARVQDRAWARRDARHLQLTARTALDELVLLKSISATTSSMADLDKLLARLTTLIQEALKVEIVSLMLADDEGNLRIQAAAGLPDKVLGQTRPPEEYGVAGQVFASGQAILVDDLETDGRFAPQTFSERYRTHSLLSVPVSCHDKTFGVLNVNNKENGETFAGSDLELLQSIAHQAALAIENFRLIHRVVQQNRELAQAHGELLSFHRDRARFVSSLSHELKTPLTSVLGFADLILEMFDQLDRASMKDYLSSIHTEALQLETLLSGMLRFFSIDTDTEQWHWESLDFKRLVTDVCQRFSVVMAEKELDFKLTIAEDLWHVWGAADKVALLLDALFDNTVRYNRVGGTLRITVENCRENGTDHVKFLMTSQGQGFPREEVKAFLLPNQGDDVDVNNSGIVGIGLATCRAILHKLHGWVFLEESDGEETVLGFVLPTHPKAIRKGVM